MRGATSACLGIGNRAQKPQVDRPKKESPFQRATHRQRGKPVFPPATDGMTAWQAWPQPGMYDKTEKIAQLITKARPGWPTQASLAALSHDWPRAAGS